MSSWQHMLAARREIVAGFADVTSTALVRRDTTSPAFHGCVDWHSAVHGTWALLAAARITGDERYRDVAAEAVGGRSNIAAEEEHLRAGLLLEEVPYGVAWSLHLDLEARRAGLDEFSALASLARDRLVSHLRRSRGDVGRLVSSEYASNLWAADALARWSARWGDDEGRDVAGLVMDAALHPSALAEVTRSGPVPWRQGFFSPPHLLAGLADHVEVPASALGRVLEVIRQTRPLEAGGMRRDHAAGLNFSRAWGCWAAWHLTEDRSFLDLGAALVMHHAAMPAFWRDDYLAHGHWVPQFGVFAVAQAERAMDHSAKMSSGDDEGSIT